MNRERLLKLADHLEKGKLFHDMFNFGLYSTAHETNPIIPAAVGGGTTCGTMGCALGECPTVFPDEWVLIRGYPNIVAEVVEGYAGAPRNSAAKFFDIDPRAVDHLFYPDHQNIIRYGGKDLNSTATKEEVAANIRAFVEVMDHAEVPR